MGISSSYRQVRIVFHKIFHKNQVKTILNDVVGEISNDISLN